MSRIITIGMQKGGVGKTTCTVNLAASMAANCGLKVLVLDFDSQCNATQTMLGAEMAEALPAGSPTIESVLREEVTLPEAMVQSPHHPNLFVVPGSQTLITWELEIENDSRDDAAWRVREVIRRSLPDDIDVVLIDTPPAVGVGLQAALTASDGYIIVARPERYSAQAAFKVLETADRIRDSRNDALELDGIIVNQVKSTRRESDEYIQAYRKFFPGQFLEPPITDLAAVNSAITNGMPVEFFDRKSKAAENFRTIARTLAQRLGLLRPTTAKKHTVFPGMSS